MTVELNFNVDDYLEQAVKFLHDNEWIFKSSNTEYLKNNILKNLPEEWIQTFETCTENEFKNIPSGYCNVRSYFLYQLINLILPYFRLIGLNL